MLILLSCGKDSTITKPITNSRQGMELGRLGCKGSENKRYAQEKQRKTCICQIFLVPLPPKIKRLKPYAIHILNATAETANETITYSDTGDTYA